MKNRYPLQLSSVVKSPIWGGTRLISAWGKEAPAGTAGESWELTVRKNEKSMVMNGALAGKPLEEVIRIWRYERGGTAVPLTIGKHAYGYYRWNVVSHEMTTKYTDPEGNLMGVVVSVTLQEYLKN